MKVITCNLFVDYDGERTQEVINSKILVQMDPDVILLQEVHYKQKHRFDEALVGYNSMFDISTGMGCAVYVKNNLQVSDKAYIPYSQTFMERGIYAVEVDGTLFITTHLESMDKPQFEKIRQVQLREIESFISGYKRVVIGMDSNIKGEIKMRDVVDVWEDSQLSTWFANRFFNHDGEERYDRFLIKGLSVLTRKIIQNKTSDHDILFCDFELKQD